MFRIGEFSRIARVSCRQLRFYNETGLLRPARVDAASDLHFYSAAQLSRLNRILVLRDLGLSLTQIGRALEEELSTDELRGMLDTRRGEVDRSIEEEAQRLGQIESRITQIEAEGRLSTDDVVLRSEPARRLLAIRQRIPSLEERVRLIGELVVTIPTAVSPSVLGQFIAIMHAEEFELENIDVEMGFFLQPGAPGHVRLAGDRELFARELAPIAKLAACVHTGPPQEAHLTTARIAHFIEANGYRICGPSREVFLQRPRADRMQDAVIEMQFPVAGG